MYLRRIRDRINRRYAASFAEVGYQDLWQRARVVVALAASDPRSLEQGLEGIKGYLDSQEWVLTSTVTEVLDVEA